MVQYRLGLTMGENILSPGRASLVVGIIKGYEIDIAKNLEREIHNWAMNTDTNLAFPCLLT